MRRPRVHERSVARMALSHFPEPRPDDHIPAARASIVC